MSTEKSELMKRIPEVKKSFLNKLFSSSGVILTPHLGPDGDAVASTASLCFMLSLKNIPHLVLCEKTEDFIKELKKLNSCLSQELSLNVSNKINSSDKKLLGCSPIHAYVDCSQKNRIGSMLSVIENSNILHDTYLNTIAIDHHERADNFIESYIDKDAPSTGHLMFNIMKSSFDLKSIPNTLSTSIYYAIASDTDNFRHLTSNDAETFSIAETLVELGANPGIIYSAMHGGKPLESIEYMAKVLSSVKILKKGAVLIALDDEFMFKSYGREKRPSNAIYDILLGIQCVELVVYLKYKEDGNIEGSLRVPPKSTYQAHEIARLIANGGGHEKAAGFTFVGTMEEAYVAIEKLIKKRIKEIKK